METVSSTASLLWMRPPAKVRRIKDEVQELIDPDEDSVLFCDLGLLARLDEPTFSYIGRAREVTESDALIL